VVREDVHDPGSLGTALAGVRVVFLVPLIDAVGIAGKLMGSILARPDEHHGKVVHGAERLYSLEEIALAMSKAAGQQVIYRRVSA
jgi:uncharacterized protein YbjT (DUF2867 family)